MLKLGVVAWMTLAFSVFIACSENRTSLGNSAESGNPELAGIIRFGDGSHAAFAHVAVVPASYSALDGEALDSAYTGVTDSLGHYSFDKVPAEGFSLEALDSATGQKFLKLGIQAPSDSNTLDVDGVLEEAGSVRLGAHGFADGTSGFVYVPGTTILRPVTVVLGNIFVDSLPADSLYPFIFVSNDGYELSLSKGVNVLSDSTVQVDAEKVSLEFKIPLNTEKIGLSEDLVHFPLTFYLDSSDFDFTGMDRLNGSWTAVLCGDTIPLEVSYSDAKSGKFTFWARIPKLRKESQDTLLLSFAEGAQESNKYAVFSDGFIAAWHFDEGADTVTDATGNLYDGVPESLTVAEEAVAGSALYYGGTSGSVTIPGTAQGEFDVNVTDSITFSVWVKMEGSDRSRVIFAKGATQYHLMYLAGSDSKLWLYEAYTDEIFGTDSTTQSARYWYRDSSAVSDVWTYLTVVQDSSGAKLYVNDSLIAATAAIGASSEARVTDSLFRIGKLTYPMDSETNSVTHYFSGIIDELHVSRVSRSEAWIKASYANQNPAVRWPLPMSVR
ncbi:MAG: LamG domain-containing protein [Fibrobacter sp.]|nr:LamG domain-containing protein [Fibrobacter sp.]